MSRKRGKSLISRDDRYRSTTLWLTCSGSFKNMPWLYWGWHAYTTVRGWFVAFVNLTFLEYFSSLNFYLLNKCLGIPLILLLEVILSRLPTEAAWTRTAKGLHGDFAVPRRCHLTEFDTFAICALGVFCILSPNKTNVSCFFFLILVKFSIFRKRSSLGTLHFSVVSMYWVNKTFIEWRYGFTFVRLWSQDKYIE